MLEKLSEENEHQRGVAIMMSQATQKCLIEWTPVSSRITTARFFSRFKNTTVIQVYALMTESTDDEKDDFYDQLQSTFERRSVMKSELRRRWNWIGHVLKKERNDDCMVAMEWQPKGKREVGRPKTTWRRTVEKESRQKRWTSWAEAQDRASWREKVTALCTSWRGEN